MDKPKIILASASRARQEMLRNAGLNFQIQPADIDETAIIKSSLHASCVQSTDGVALELAKAKALKIAAQNPNALVIGSDQILEHNNKIFEKAKTVEEARAKLKTLRGQTHHLISAVAVAQNDQILWENAAEAELSMHDFTDAFLDAYIAQAGDDLISCVGAYALEKSGAWLFSEIKGDYHTILGMPLLPLLGYLREAHGLKP